MKLGAAARDCAVGLLAWAWVRSLRLTLVESAALAREPRPRAHAFWHGHQFALLAWARRRSLVALVSASRDGGLVAAALARLGVATARGSSSRGGARALRDVVRRMRASFESAFAVDGPRGPRGVVRTDSDRAGVAVAADLAGGVVVPLASACARPIVFSRSWDRFELPLPFTRVVVALGAPLEPGEATPDRLAAAIDQTRATALEALTQRPALTASAHPA
ncbi:MAG TPA: DUF374 domain-containing protein [Byssovorax sp.]